MVKSDSKDIAGATTVVEGFEIRLCELFLLCGVYLAIQEDECHFGKSVIELFKGFIELFIVIWPFNFRGPLYSRCDEIGLDRVLL
jgi:hypothetical protein